MQILPIYLYNNNLDVILDLDSSVRGVNRVMYQHDLKVQKGIKNKIRVQFKNSDQKRINISSTQTYVFTMFDAIDRRQLLQKELEVLDDGTTYGLRGVAQLTLTESDTLDLERTSYQYSIKYQDPADGTYIPAYSNTYYGISGVLYLLEDQYPVLQPSQEMISFLKSYNADTQLYEHKGGNVYAYPEFNSNTALHTMAMYMTNFRGTVYIQGTMYNSPQSFNRYFTIESRIYSGFTGIDYVNFNGVFSYVRVMYVPERGPTDYNNDNPDYYGSFDKVLYRC